MTAPKQVQAQSERIKQLYEEMLKEESGAGDDGGDGDGDGDNNDGGAAPVSPPPPPPPPPAPTATVDLAQYNSVVNAYNRDVGALNERVKQLETLLASADNKSEANTPKSLITEDERREYGDSIEVMRKAAREEVSSEMAQLRQQLGEAVKKLEELGAVAPKVQQLDKSDRENREYRFFQDLTRLVPDWQTANTNDDFLLWLETVDNLTGIKRQAYLDDAFNRGDVARVAEIFRTGMKATGLSDSDGEKSDTGDKKKKELEAQVAPGRSKSGGSGQNPQKKVYTPQDIANFYKDVAHGKYRGREAARFEIENDIFQAQAEGRVRA